MNRRAFTMLEITITFGLLIVLVVGSIVLLDPRTIVGRGTDTQRKTDLKKFKAKLEEYYNDKGCYPRLDEVCYQGGINGTLNLVNTNVVSCVMCGTEASSPTLSPYLDKLPCDPKSHTYDYLYNIKDKTEKDCPKSYVLYAKLSNPGGPDSLVLGCGIHGCGPIAPFGYDYGISSPNVKVNATKSFACLSNVVFECNTCGLYTNCSSSSTCTQGKIYSSVTECIASNPGAN